MKLNLKLLRGIEIAVNSMYKNLAKGYSRKKLFTTIEPIRLKTSRGGLIPILFKKDE